MAVFEMEIKGARALGQAARRYPQIARPVIDRAIKATNAVLAKHTLKENPVPWRTGNLLQSFRFRSGAGWARWYPTANYAMFVEMGTRPHVITPRRARVLAWKTGSAGGYVTSASGRRYYKAGTVGMRFARKVNHPGTRPQPFMQAILDNSSQDIEALFAQAADRILSEIGKGVQ
jgi:hypothetical protein